MIWIIAIAAVVMALAALAWWTSGRAKPLGRRQHSGMTRTERHYDPSQSADTTGGGGLI
jgi:hypothetical protein